MIEVDHLSKRYGPIAAVDDVSFRVESGQILGFLGPNGAGKTTTMRIITGFMPATSGKAVVAGYDVFEQPLEAKRRTGYLPETPPLYPDMTVREYLTFVAKIKGLRSHVKDRVDEVMKRTWVADMADRHCGKLSKGYKQRVGLAQAIIHNPDVLVLDEPTAGLDPEADHRDPAADSRARRHPHHRAEHPHPPRGLADLPAGRHHQQGPRRRGRLARQPDPPAGRARRRSSSRRTVRPRTPRTRCGTCAASPAWPGPSHTGRSPASRWTPKRAWTSGASSPRPSSPAAGASPSCGRCA